MALGAVGAPFSVQQPPELVEHLSRVGSLFAAAAR